MKPLRMINRIVTLLIILTSGFIGISFFRPDLFITKFSPISDHKASLDQVESSSSTGIETMEVIRPETISTKLRQAPLPNPAELASFFPLPLPPAQPPAPAKMEAAMQTIAEEEPSPKIIYNDDRLVYLGYTVGSQRTETITYLLKDNLYTDVFGIVEGETSRGFKIIKAENKTLFLSDGEEMFRVRWN